MQNVKGYEVINSDFRWEYNTKGGITLQTEMVAYVDQGSGTPKRVPMTWFSIANVYKAKRGNRYIAEVKGHKKLFPFLTLREAMRMAKFLYQTKQKF